jgi:APA family basic amino acid/polyamine antiporter
VQKPSNLTPAIGLVPATAMVVGTIIGASIFVQPSVITARVPTLAGVMLAWLTAGLLTLCGALVAAELASAFPRSGGVYCFLTETYGRGAGFLWGWAMFWTMHSGILAAIAMVFARYVGYFTVLDATGLRMVAIGAVLLLTGINYAGVRAGSRVQSVITFLKVGAVAGIVLVAFVAGPRATVQPVPVTSSIGFSSFVLAVGAGLFAFGGWHMVTYAADETLTPERTIPRALAIGTLIVTACYLALNAAYLHVLPLPAVIASHGVAADAADAVLGHGGATIAAGIVVVSTLGALNGIVLAGPRVYYAMARDGLLFPWIGAVHPRHRTPSRAIALQGLWTSVLIATGRYETLFSRVIYTEWFFFGLMAVALIVLRRKPAYQPRFRAPLYPLLPILFAAAAFAVAINQVIATPGNAIVGIGLVLTGLPVYWLWRKNRESRIVNRESQLTANG